MRILFITSWWPTRVHPTHGNFIQKHARLVSRRHELTVITIQEDVTLGPSSMEVKDVCGADYREIIVYYGRPSSLLSVVHPLLRARAYRAGLRRWSGGGRTVRPDVIHGHILIDGGLVAAVVAKIWRIPYVITEHATVYQWPGGVSALRVQLGRWACRAAARVLPVSEYLATAMREIYHLPGEYTVVPNVVDTNTFRLPTGIRDRPHAPFRLLHVSNFHPQQKNVEGLLRTYSQLCEAYPDRFHLHVAGDGAKENIEALAHTLSLEAGALTLSGPHTEQQIAALMADADALVLFSNYESQGVVLLEALCCGLPSVATAVGGVTEVIFPGQNGLLVPARDEDALRKAIVALADMYAQFDPNLLRNSAVRIYGDDAVLAKLSTIYREVTKVQ